MAHEPWVPPYFGSWADLISYVLHNPFGPSRGPSPDPWRLAVSGLVTAVNAKVLAATLEGALRKQAEESASSAIARILDDYCGTPPKAVPWPFPGPPPWLIPIAEQLSGIANMVEAGPLRDGLNQVAGQVMQRGMR